MKDKSPRRYPKFYEKNVPLILGIISFLMVLLIAFTIAVLAGWQLTF